MLNVIIKFIILLNILISSCDSKKTTYQWQSSGLWSQCSVSCGVGVQYNSLFCVKKTLIGTFEKVVDEKCRNVKKPNNMMVRSCLYGNCPLTNRNEYTWKVSKWSTCSASCGGDGFQTRDVQCVLLFSNGHYLEAKDQNCKSYLEPIKSQKCGFSDCPPEFFKTPWDKCSKMKNCNAGIKRRKINCIATLKNGSAKSVSSWSCYMRSKPPKTWEKCYDDPEYQQKCKFKNSKEKMLTPVISVINSNIHQMRHGKKLKLTVGQTAYAFPHSRLVIKCSVQNYAISNLQWKRLNVIYKHDSNSKSRTFINAKGHLIIKQLLPEDEGIWTCVAGVISANITLKLKNPSEGYSDWLGRIMYLKQDIILIKNNSTIKYIKSVFHQWVVGSWSSCSKTCGVGGIQIRRISCERIEPRYFEEVHDKKCEKESISKPENVRNCSLFPTCPLWSLDEPDTSKCTNICVDIGKSLKNVRVICKYEDQILPSSNCDSATRPTPTCSNSNCMVHWKISDWSSCSSSCGNAGFSIRNVNCFWKNSNYSAGNLCNKIKLQLPNLFKICYPPQCNLVCVDLFKYCGVKSLCYIDHYQYFCCRTCSSDDVTKSRRFTNKD